MTEPAQERQSSYVQSPDRPVSADEVPTVVAEIADGAAIRWIWHNELDGRTFRIDRTDRTEFVKWSPDHPEIDLALEAAKLNWARSYITVPEVIGHGRDSRTSSWLHTVGIAAQSAIAPTWKEKPLIAARAIGSGLRTLHDRLPVADCPWSWQVADRATMISKDEDRGLVDQAPAIDKLVVCHGDSCAPNTLIDTDNQCAGHVDLGNLGVADRWADLAIATYSLDWNYQPAFEEELLAAYGIERDEARIDYYRRLWDAT